VCLQKFQGIEEEHVMRMQEIIHSYSQSVEETHIQIGEVSRQTCTLYYSWQCYFKMLLIYIISRTLS